MSTDFNSQLIWIGRAIININLFSIFIHEMYREHTSKYTISVSLKFHPTAL